MTAQEFYLSYVQLSVLEIQTAKAAEVMVEGVTVNPAGEMAKRVPKQH